ncbi:MAG TPA: hypothetical protein VKB51_11580 [bacterium]|nr:hypothetical protein [bacterium]
MALFGGHFSASSREQRAVVRALAELSDAQTPVHLETESEQGSIGFYTQVSLHKTVIVVAKPRAVPGGLPRGSHIRLTLPNRRRRQVRLAVLVPHVKLPFSQRYACVCALPEEFSGQCRRGADRLNTKRYGNLRLAVSEQDRLFRVLDLSATGLRIFTGADSGLMMFEEGMEIGAAKLKVGKRVEIELEQLLPRSRGANWVGLEMKVVNDGASDRLLLNLLNKLREAELSRLSIDAV